VLLGNTEFAAIADSEALIYTRSAGTGVGHVLARDLRTGDTTMLRMNVPAPQVTAVRDGVVAFVEYPLNLTGDPRQRVRVFAGRWRDPSSITALDDFEIQVIGGDSWNPQPSPQTNGWEVIWMHAAPDSSAFDLRLREADGRIRTIYTSKRPFTFALARNGDVAISDIATVADPRPVELKLVRAGNVRSLIQRSESGYVRWSGGKIAWPLGLGLVANVRGVELIDASSGARETVAPPPGCLSYSGATDAQISFVCGDHVQLVGGAGPTRVGPPVPFVNARALIRIVGGAATLAFVAPVVTNDPRPGSGAQF